MVRTCTGLLAAWLALTGPAAQQLPSRDQPAFRTAVDIIPIDVVVLGSNGAQVSDLQADAFTVTIDGRPRHVVSSRYVAYGRAPRPPGAAVEAEATVSSATPRVSTNQGPPGRLVMMVVDEAGMDFGGTRVAIEGVKRLVATLSPSDLVGLSVLPNRGVTVPFTGDHGRVLEAMSRVPGQPTVHEAVTYRDIGWAEALAYARNKYSPEWSEVVGRECYQFVKKPRDDYSKKAKPVIQDELADPYRQCVRSVEAEASHVLLEIAQRVAEFSGAMRRVLAYLHSFEGPKTVVLLSSGLIGDPRDNEIDSLGREAAAAGCSIYVLHFGSWAVPDASGRMPSPSRSADLELQRRPLESLAGRTRGWIFDVYGSAEAPFEKLSAELAGFYLLGVEPEASDRDGRTHRITVEVARKNVSVRSRRELVWRESPLTARSPVDVVRAMLASPIPVGDVPLRVTAYTGPASERGKLRTLIAAEIGPESAMAEELTVGWALVDTNGKVAATGSERATLVPAADRTRGPLSFVRAHVVPAGQYTFKLAVADAAGRGGSVTHEVDARLHSAGPLTAGDLVIGAPPADAKADFQPPVDCVIEGDRLFVYLPFTSLEAPVLAKAAASVEITRSKDDRALLQSAIRLAGGKTNQRAVQASVPLGLLPPGTYVARVRLLVGGSEVGTASRSFIFAPAPGRSGGAGAGAPAAASEAPRLALGDIFAAQTLSRFVEDAAKAAPDLPAAVFDEARAGRFEAAVRALPDGAGGPAPPFLRGLALLQRAEWQAAGDAFAESRRSSPGFFDAAFFMGVCFAAAGNDRDAVGAWQTARLGLDDQPIVHRLLIDARLRQQQVAQARAVAEEAAKRWPDDSRFQVQLARTLAAGNDAAAALSTLEPHLVAHKDDVDALFLALRLLYASASASKAKPAAGVVERFRNYAALYDAASGPDRALVHEWLKYVTR